jgi:hypothetical protein
LNMERFHQEAFEMWQVQERQQQVEVAAAVHAQRLSASVILEKIEANQGKENGRPASQHPNGAPPSGQNWPLLQPESEALGSHHLWERGSHEYGGQELQTPGKGHWLSSSPQEQLPILTPQSTILTQPRWKPPVSPRAQLTEIQQEEAEQRRMEEKNPFGATSQAMLSASPESSIGFGPQTSPSSSLKFYGQFQDEDAYKAASLNAHFRGKFSGTSFFSKARRYSCMGFILVK